MLRLSVQETILPGLDLERKWEFAQEVGYSGIELCGGSELRERMPELTAALKSGVSMTSVCVITDRYIGDFDADRRADHAARPGIESHCEVDEVDLHRDIR